jgi:hypothetical protein
MTQGSQGGQSLNRSSVAFVGDVVGGPGQRVDGSNGRTQARRAEPGGDGEIFVVTHIDNVR